MKTVTRRPPMICLDTSAGTRVAAFAGALMLAGLLLLTGCAGQMARLDEKDRAALSGVSDVHAIHHKSHRVFEIDSTGHTAASQLISPLFAVVGVYEGMALQKEFGLEDPAPQVKARLVTALQSDLGVASVRVVDEPPVDDAVTTLDRQFRTGIVLDVRTMKWGLDNARGQYSARARLIRLADARVLWEATCKPAAGEEAPGPELEALKANGGELLKAKVGEAVTTCADQLSAWMVGSAQ